MLESLSSSLESFKNVSFVPGLNIALATRTKKSKKDSRNSVGKSSMVSLIDYLLASDGGKGHLTMHPRLQNETFTLNLDMKGRNQRVDRSGADPKSPSLNGARLELSELRRELGTNLFHLSGIAEEPTFRAAIAFYLRKREEGGFLSPLRTHGRQADIATATAITYLLNLDASITNQAKQLKDSRISVTSLSKAARDPIFGRAISNIADLDAEIGTLRVTIDLAQQDLKGFRVIEQYASHVERADLLSRQIRAENDELIILEQKKNDLLHALEIEDDEQPDHSYLAQVYKEVGLALPMQTLRSFDEVAAFHASVVRNRSAYLSRELSETKTHIERHAKKLQQLDSQRAEIMILLQSGGALETFSEIQKKLSKATGRFAELRERKESTYALANAKSHLAAKEYELEARTRMDLRDRSNQIEEIGDFFTRLAFDIYGTERTASLSILESISGYHLAPTISGDRGGGVANITLFCFDLTLAVMAKREGRGPDFFIHDSHLFDGVEARQIGTALRVASEVCEREGFQYITALNTDILESALVDESNLSFHTAVTLTDEYENGGLFGIRFN